VVGNVGLDEGLFVVCFSAKITVESGHAEG
jgi:hypothetical protein